MKKLLFRGPVLTASGYGVHSRQILAALVKSKRYDVRVDSIRWGETAFLEGEEVEWIKPLIAARKPEDHHDVAVLVTIPNEFKREAPITIGITAGIEVDRVSPEWLLKCNAEVDAVIVPSHHSMQAFSVGYQTPDGKTLRLERPIIVVPESVDTSIYSTEGESNFSPLIKDAPDKNFVFVGLGLDKPNGMDRKNVTKLVEWFCKAFKGRSDVGLVLKTSIVNGSLIDFETVKKRISEIKSSTIGDEKLPQIRVIHGRVSEKEMAELYLDPRVVAAVSITHGEGYGLPLIEAAACGCPVIATDWSGHLDFLTIDGKKKFRSVAFDMAEIPQQCVWPGVMEQGSHWANPKEESLIELLNDALDPSKLSNDRHELAAHIVENYSVDRVAATLVSVVDMVVAETSSSRPQTREDAVAVLKARFPDGKDWAVLTMPMSAGDVYLASTLVSKVRETNPGKKAVLATLPQYVEIADGTWDDVITWEQWMTDVSLLEDVFSAVYTPNLSIQMNHANWVRKGKGRNILEEMHVQCGFPTDVLELPSMMGADPCSDVDKLVEFVKKNKKIVAVHAGSGSGQWSARRYGRWVDVVKNLQLAGAAVVQVGAKDDVQLKCDVDLRGRSSYRQLPQVLKNCNALVSIDSFPMHVAATIDVPVVALFGGSYAHSTGPLKAKRLTLIETTDRHGCDRACYKNECLVDQSNPCINEINPADVYQAVISAAKIKTEHDFSEVRPSISGYTHVLNAKTFGYPFIESIRSMLGFCAEVVVVDGGSTDGTKEAVEAIDPRVSVFVRQWDPKEPGMDGMQKALGRAMCSPDADFLWQQDADEVVHEEDYAKVIEVARSFPSDVGLVHLPVIELWGGPDDVRTDRHSWKWRMSKSDFRITHGINAGARVIDEKSGRVYAKKGMSDGCEYIDVITGEFVRHRGFYNDEIEKLRQTDPDEYGRRMNELFKKLPCVYHYSWCDLPRKVRNFKDFWDKQWSVLHGESEPSPRFPDVVTDVDVGAAAAILRERGGEHGHAKLFKLERTQPEIMKGWLQDVAR